jgi:hypothetical protein
MDEKCCPVGPGGNRELINQDEAEILVRTTQGLQTRSEGMQEPGRH